MSHTGTLVSHRPNWQHSTPAVLLRAWHESSNVGNYSRAGVLQCAGVAYALILTPLLIDVLCTLCVVIFDIFTYSHFIGIGYRHNGCVCNPVMVIGYGYDCCVGTFH